MRQNRSEYIELSTVNISFPFESSHEVQSLFCLFLHFEKKNGTRIITFSFLFRCNDSSQEPCITVTLVSFFRRPSSFKLDCHLVLVPYGSSSLLPNFSFNHRHFLQEWLNRFDIQSSSPPVSRVHTEKISLSMSPRFLHPLSHIDSLSNTQHHHSHTTSDLSSSSYSCFSLLEEMRR